MKATDTKTTTQLHTQTEAEQQPFFQKEGADRTSAVSEQPFFQPKLKVGRPGDKYEREADATADRVVNQLPAPAVQAKCAACEAEEEEIQRKPIFESAEEQVQQKAIAPSLQLQEAEAAPDEEMKEVPEEEEMVQAKCAACEEEGEDVVQSKSEASPEPAGPDLESRLNSTKGKGSPLPEETQSSMGSALGADFGGVRVHTGSSAVQMSQELGAHAFTHGSDIYFNAGKYDTGSKDGQRLLAHELVHVTQQRGKIQPKIQRFEAAHHEHVERGALGGEGGFSDEELNAVYFGNWSRDFSQVFINNPLTNAIGNELLFEILNVLAIHKFGRQLNPKDFGIYSPREHIDNPVGQVNQDLKRGDERLIRQFGLDQQAQNPEEDISSPEAVRQLFAVNEEGLPAYLGRSIQYVEEEFSQSANLGRTQDGLMHFGNGLHTVEDLFAHSNYIEICIGKLYGEGRLPMSQNLREELENRTNSQESAGRIIDPVETFGARTEGGRPILLTGTFTTTDTYISILEALIAFLNEFDPFGPSNDERSRNNTEMILGRVDELRESGHAGTIVRSFMTSMGSTISNELTGAVSNVISGQENEPQESQNILGRFGSFVRRGAGSFVGTSMNFLGQVMRWDWIQNLFGFAANSFSQISFLEIYRFIVGVQNRLDQFFENIKGRILNMLRRLPAPVYNFLSSIYHRIKNFIDTQLDRLREMLKFIIQAILRMVASLLQKILVRWMVSRTNIQGQIDRDLNTIEENVANNARNPHEIDRFRNASLEEKLELLYDPNWRRLAEMSEVDVERLRQMIQSPEYIRQGPSHSQIAKDHADSPFFGTAAIFAGLAIRTLRDKMTAIWNEEGSNTQTLTDNYQEEISPDIASRRAAAGTASGNMTTEQRIAEDEAVETSFHYPEIRSREEGTYLIREGHMDEDHGNGEASLQILTRQLGHLLQLIHQIPGRLRVFADQLDALAPDLARYLRNMADMIPEDLEGLLEEIQSTTDNEQIQHLIDRLNSLIERKNAQFEAIKRTLYRVASIIEGFEEPLQEMAEQIRDLADFLGSMMVVFRSILHQISIYFANLTDFERVTREQFINIRNLEDVVTSEWEPSLRESHFQSASSGIPISSPREELRNYVREQIFGHPYDTNWWEDSLINWCQDNQERLENYIRARNEGRVHDH